MALNTEIVIVGCGPGEREWMTAAGERAIRDAEVLVGARRLLELWAAPHQECIAVGAEIESALTAIAERWEIRRITVLVTGDPGLSSLAKPVVRRFGRAACRILPGVSSVQLAFARLGLDWLDARILTAHDRLPELSTAELVRWDKIAILAGHRRAQAWIADLAHDLALSHRLVVCEDLSLAEESIRSLDAAAFRRLTLSGRTIVLLVKGGGGEFSYP